MVIVLTVSLGNWQRHRAEEKRQLALQMQQALVIPPVNLAEVPDAANLSFRHIFVDGEYVAEKQVYIDNKIHDGKPGYSVITPLKVNGAGLSVLVNRGWAPLMRDRAQLPVAPVPPGRVHVTGTGIVPTGLYVELKTDRHPGALWQNLDIQRIATASGLSLMPVVVQQETADPGLQRDSATPDFGRDKHLIYMVQWYSLAGLAAVLWLLLNWKRGPARSDEHD